MTTTTKLHADTLHAIATLSQTLAELSLAVRADPDALAMPALLDDLNQSNEDLAEHLPVTVPQAAKRKGARRR